MAITGKEVFFELKYTQPNPPRGLRGAKLAEYIQNRAFYTCNQKFDYIDYTEAGARDIVTYAKDNKKTDCIFTQEKILEKQDIKELRSKLRETKSIIWHGFISFQKAFGDQYCNTDNKAIHFMQRSFVSKFLSKTHLNPDNIVWFASLHKNTLHHNHIHICFFEKEPHHIRNGKKTYTKNGNIAKGVFASARTEFFRFYIDKETQIFQRRDNMLEAIKEIHKVYRDTNASKSSPVLKKIYELSKKLPLQGSLKYGSANMATLRNSIDEITKSIIKNDDTMSKEYKQLCAELAKRDKTIKEYCLKNNKNPAKFMRSAAVKQDFLIRSGNKIIQTAFYIRKTEGQSDEAIATKFIRKKKRRERDAIFREYLHLLHTCNIELNDIFEQFMRNLSRIEQERLIVNSEFENEG